MGCPRRDHAATPTLWSHLRQHRVALAPGPGSPSNGKSARTLAPWKALCSLRRMSSRWISCMVAVARGVDVSNMAWAFIQYLAFLSALLVVWFTENRPSLHIAASCVGY